MKFRVAGVAGVFLSLLLSLTPLTLAQTSSHDASALPRLVRFGGTVKELNGKPLTGVVGVTFSLYSEQTGGAPLWLETQNVTADSQGHYTVLLGSTKPDGLPAELFTSEQARWVGVQVSGQAEQPRVLLVSAPYALKAGDAETIGGLPPSAFVLAAPMIGAAAATQSAPSAAEVTPLATSDVTTTGGTANTIPMFTTATNIQNSILTQTSTTAINVGGKLNLPATATASAGSNSRPQTFVASVFNSTTSTAVPQTFQWQAEAVNNDKTTASGTLNLLYASGTATPAESGVSINNGGLLTTHGLSLPALGAASSTSTAGFASRPLDLFASSWDTAGTPAAVSQHFRWQAEPAGSDTASPAGTVNLLYATGTATPANILSIASNGKITFAAGQTFPGTGTVTSVTAGAGLAGGTITKTGTISLAAGGVTNADLAHDSLTVNAGADLTGGGAVLLGGSTTLNLDTTKVPLLASANTFTTNQTVNGTLTATSFSGSGASVTNVNAAELGSVAASGYPTLAGINDFSGGFSNFEGAWSSWEVEVINTGGGNGIIAYNEATSGTSAGVYAASLDSTTGLGVFGLQGSESGEGGTVSGLGRGVGVWGDGGTTSSGMGVAGTVDNGDAGYFRNNSASGWQTVWVQADNSATTNLFEAINGATGGYCYIDSSGDINCSGSKNAVVPIDGGARTVAMSAIEAPQNWFEDAGSAELVKGVAVVTLDHDFTQTVNSEMDYKVFPVPNGDCKGLYVTNKTATSFEVRELGGGTSNVRFDYRIMALRRKYETVRFADHTREIEQSKMMQSRTVAGAAHSHKPNGSQQLRQPSTKAMLTPTATKSATR